MSDLGRVVMPPDAWAGVILKHLSIKTRWGLIKGCQCGRLSLGQSYTNHLRAALADAGLPPQSDPHQKEHHASRNRP